MLAIARSTWHLRYETRYILRDQSDKSITNLNQIDCAANIARRESVVRNVLNKAISAKLLSPASEEFRLQTEYFLALFRYVVRILLGQYRWIFLWT